MAGYEYIRHIYQIDEALKSYEVYRLSSCSHPLRVKLSQLIRIEPYKQLANSYGITECVRGRTATRWAKNARDGFFTGLRPTVKPLVFHGNDPINNKNLVLVRFSEDRQTLFIDYFNGFRANNINQINQLV